MSSVQYRECMLGAPLDALVECVWFLSGTDNRQIPERIPPDGCTEVVFHLAAPFEQVTEGRAVAQPAALVIGIWTRPIELLPPTCFDTVGVRFRPGCASSFLHEPAAEFTNRAVDASAVFGSAGGELREQLASAGDVTARLAHVRTFLIARLRPRRQAAARSLDLIVRTAGRASIDRIARDAAIGHRRLERAFAEEVGVPAKLLSRIVRFQNVLRQRRPRSPLGWAALATACGYSDQSHLIRDFAQFAGETPTELVAAEGSLAEFFRTPERLERLFRTADCGAGRACPPGADT